MASVGLMPRCRCVGADEQLEGEGVSERVAQTASPSLERMGSVLGMEAAREVEWLDALMGGKAKAFRWSSCRLPGGRSFGCA